jgi:hypothetical protein
MGDDHFSELEDNDMSINVDNDGYANYEDGQKLVPLLQLLTGDGRNMTVGQLRSKCVALAKWILYGDVYSKKKVKWKKVQPYAEKYGVSVDRCFEPNNRNKSKGIPKAKKEQLLDLHGALKTIAYKKYSKYLEDNESVATVTEETNASSIQVHDGNVFITSMAPVPVQQHNESSSAIVATASASVKKSNPTLRAWPSDYNCQPQFDQWPLQQSQSQGMGTSVTFSASLATDDSRQLSDKPCTPVSEDNVDSSYAIGTSQPDYVRRAQLGMGEIDTRLANSVGNFNDVPNSASNVPAVAANAEMPDGQFSFNAILDEDYEDYYQNMQCSETMVATCYTADLSTSACADAATAKTKLLKAMEALHGLRQSFACLPHLEDHCYCSQNNATQFSKTTPSISHVPSANVDVNAIGKESVQPITCPLQQSQRQGASAGVFPSPSLSTKTGRQQFAAVLHSAASDDAANSSAATGTPQLCHAQHKSPAMDKVDMRSENVSGTLSNKPSTSTFMPAAAANSEMQDKLEAMWASQGIDGFNSIHDPGEEEVDQNENMEWTDVDEGQPSEEDEAPPGTGRGIVGNHLMEVLDSLDLDYLKQIYDKVDDNIDINLLIGC